MKTIHTMLLLGAVVAAPLNAQISGTDVLTRMHDKYAGKWYKTLTFVQKTIRPGRNGGAPTEQTWYESLQFDARNGAWLRIDQGDVTAGNGVLYTSDSSWNVRGGTARAGTANGNQFIPLIENVYLQPVATTIKQLESQHYDLSKVVDVTWNGRPAWAVGAMSATDTISPQFWVDKGNLALVRMFLATQPNAPAMDVRLEKFVETGGGWLATKVTMLRNGAPVQTEEYSDWKTNVSLDSKLFDINSWTTAKHWAKPQ